MTVIISTTNSNSILMATLTLMILRVIKLLIIITA